MIVPEFGEEFEELPVDGGDRFGNLPGSRGDLGLIRGTSYTN